MVDIAKLRRAIELDLQAKFPSPSLQQQQVISAVRGMLHHAEQRESGSRGDDAGLEYRCDSPNIRNSGNLRRSTRSVDDCLRQIREMQQ